MERNHDLSDVVDRLDRIESALAAPKPVDWHAVARDAAVQIYARAHGPHVMLGTAVEACNSALALVAEMKKHDGFGGGP